MSRGIPGKNIVLLGIGHTNAHVLKMWRMHPISGARLICVSNFPWATYSGMLPGVLAGQYSPAEMQIDLMRLCQAAGALLIVGETTGMAARQLLFANRAPMPFDVLSVGIGSHPSFQDVDIQAAADRIVAIKPMQTFLPRLDERLMHAASSFPHRCLKIVIVGAGVSGCEIAMCLLPHLCTLLPGRSHEIVLVHGQAEILSGMQASTRRRVMRVFADRGYRLLLDDRAKAVDQQGLRLSSGRNVDADVVIWATGAVGPPALSAFGLPLDERGFLLTRRSLQTMAEAPVFAVGDSGTMQDQPTPKSGVYAVRQGPVLWENLSRFCHGQPLREYCPQTDFLKLMNSGDGKAIGEYRGWSFRGSWVWYWKDRIDRNFISMLQDDRPLPALPRSPPSERFSG